MPILAFHKTSTFWGLIWRVRSTTAKVCSVFQNFCLLPSRCSLFTHLEGKRWNKSLHTVEEYMSLRWYRRLLCTTVCLPTSCKMASVCMHILSLLGRISAFQMSENTKSSCVCSLLAPLQSRMTAHKAKPNTPNWLHLNHTASLLLLVY